jgi:nucleoside phosphorylase
LDDRPELLVLTALAAEAEALVAGSALEPGIVETPAELHRLTAASGRTVLGGFTGLGAAAVRRAFGDLAARAPGRPRRVVFGGVAGALRGELERGELVLVEGALDEEGAAVATDRVLTDDLARALEKAHIPFRRGLALEVGRVEGRPEAKRDLARRFPEALVVAMEDATAIRAARGLGAEVAVVRAVVDRLDDRLPDLSPALDGAGRPRPLRLAAHLALRPAAVLTLPVLARSFGRARAALDGALRASLELA